MLKNKKLNKRNRIEFCFLLYSSNKFVEYLLSKINSLFTSYSYEFNKERKCTFVKLEISLEHYLLLKNNLIFEFKKEEAKFKFIYILIDDRKLGVNFFEKNFLFILDKKEAVSKNVLKNIMPSIVCNIAIYLKLILYFYYIILKNLNLLKLKIISYVNNTSSR